MVASGSVFRPGETMQYGLVLLKFQSDEQGRLVVTEPDFSTRPIQYRRGLTSSLIQMLRQLYTLDSYGIDRGRIDFPTLDQRAIICRNFQAAKKFHLSRNKGCPPEDSGWFFGCFGMQCNHNNPSYLQSLSLLDAVSLRSESANWLALPGEVHVILARAKSRSSSSRGPT